MRFAPGCARASPAAERTCYDAAVTAMAPIEAGCLAVLAVFVWSWRTRLRQSGFRRELAAVALAAWLTEDSCIRLYGFYDYHAPWSVFVDRVPLVVALVWPVVILSARDVALALAGGDVVKSLARTGAIVLADAALIEPIAVHAGLWRWTAEGPFGVPLVGIAGWSVFAWAVSLALVKGPALAVWLAPLLTHAVLLALWWGALRWIPAPPAEGAAVSAVVIAGFLTATIWRAAHRPVGGGVLLARFAAACFFGALLVSGAPPSVSLAVWAGAFLPPWLALVRRPQTAEAPGSPSSSQP